MVALNSYDRTTDTAQFSASTVADLAKLPTTTSNGTDELADFDKVSSGSSCIVIATTDVYMLDGDTNTWRQL